MGRHCAQCQCWEENNMYSRNQWLKGDGYSRCFDCVGYVCNDCKRIFQSQNELNMHMQVHRERTVSCPVCGVTKFKSAANAVQHVESGYCPNCPGGKEGAREAIYKFFVKRRQLHQYMTEVPRLTWNGEIADGVPAYPYMCCGKAFRDSSQLLQHMDNKHGNNNVRLLLQG